MSQLKLSGDASGTGIVTVAAPNTNNTYTVTLPASAGTFAQTDVAQTFTGTQTFNGNVVFGDATSDTITATARLASDLVPSTNNARDLGTSALAYRSVYAATSFVEAGYPVVTQTDIGTAPNEIPLNQYLGDLAYQDSAAVTVGSLTASGNIILSTAGAGIDFSADSNAAGMTSELLDDYEEGTFTPVVSGSTTAGTGTYTLQSGWYTKVGDRVFIQISVRWTNHTGTGNLIVTGLPFTANASATNPVIYTIYCDNLALTANNYPTALQDQGTATINLRQAPTGGGSNTNIPMDTSADIYLTGNYRVA